MASWKDWLVFGVVGILLFPSSAPAQQTGSTATGSDAKSYMQFGMANASKGDLNGAMAAFNQALQIDPKYVPAYYGRGRIHELQKDYDSAMSEFNQAIAIDPNFLPPVYERGTLEGETGNFDAAIIDLKQAIKLDPKYASAYYNLGHVYYFRGDLDAATDQLDHALQLQPDFAQGYWVRGLVRHAQGHLLEAEADFQKSASLNYAYGAIWLWITQVENGHRGIARQNLSDALAKPDLFKAGDSTAAIAGFLLEKIPQDQLVTEASQGDPSDSKANLCEAWFYAGMVKHFAGDDKGATECFSKAIATDAKGSEEFTEATRRISK